jgi:hypothetical protein
MREKNCNVKLPLLSSHLLRDYRTPSSPKLSKLLFDAISLN